MVVTFVGLRATPFAARRALGNGAQDGTAGLQPAGRRRWAGTRLQTALGGLGRAGHLARRLAAKRTWSRLQRRRTWLETQTPGPPPSLAWMRQAQYYRTCNVPSTQGDESRPLTGYAACIGPINRREP